MKLSVIIPVYNEEQTITELLQRVIAVKNIEKEIIIVDDGSTDNTPALLRPFAQHPDIHLLTHPHNRGKGAAFQTALKSVSGDLIIVQDADLEYDPNEYPRLLEPILQGQADAVFGSRILGRMRGHYHSFYYGGRLVTLIANLLFKTRLTDVTTCYKVMRTDTVQRFNLNTNGFALCAELFAHLALNRQRIAEVPVTYHARTFQQGKKITAAAGFHLLRCLISIKLKQTKHAHRVPRIKTKYTPAEYPCDLAN